VTWSTSLSSLQGQDGIASGAEKLATSGLPGLAIVVLASCVVWLTMKLLKEKDDRKSDGAAATEQIIKAKDQQTLDAKANTTELLKVSQTTNDVANKLNVTVTQNTDQMERVEELLKQNEEALREANEIMRSLRDQRTRRS
jgi:hypothetical protein